MRCEHCGAERGDEVTGDADGAKVCIPCLEWYQDCTRSDKAYDVESILRKLAGGAVFSVRFTRRSNGEPRDMVCRFNVRKDLKGEGLAYAPNERGLICVFDMTKRGYRMIPVEGIQRIIVGGETYEF